MTHAHRSMYVPDMNNSTRRYIIIITCTPGRRRRAEPIIFCFDAVQQQQQVLYDTAAAATSRSRSGTVLRLLRGVLFFLSLLFLSDINFCWPPRAACSGHSTGLFPRRRRIIYINARVVPCIHTHTHYIY